jgi:hypothetical protein
MESISEWWENSNLQRRSAERELEEHNHLFSAVGERNGPSTGMHFWRWIFRAFFLAEINQTSFRQILSSFWIRFCMSEWIWFGWSWNTKNCVENWWFRLESLEKSTAVSCGVQSFALQRNGWFSSQFREIKWYLLMSSPFHWSSMSTFCDFIFSFAKVLDRITTGWFRSFTPLFFFL